MLLKLAVVYYIYTVIEVKGGHSVLSRFPGLISLQRWLCEGTMMARRPEFRLVGHVTCYQAFE
jgi:hypothetical protein